MSEARPFSWLGIGLSGGLINAAINAPLALLIVKKGALLSLFGLPGIAADLVAMGYGISFGTGIAVTPQTRRQLRQGRLLPPTLAPWLRWWLNTWPKGVLHRAFNLGVLSVVVFVPLPLLWLWASGTQNMDRASMAVLKGVFSFVQGAVMTPLVAAGAPFPESPTTEA
jgi:hypothetical protein